MASVCRCTQLYASPRSLDQKAPSRKTAADIRREFRQRCTASRSPRGSARERTRQPSWRNQSGSCLSSLREPESRGNNSQEPYLSDQQREEEVSPKLTFPVSSTFNSDINLENSDWTCFTARVKKTLVSRNISSTSSFVSDFDCIFFFFFLTHRRLITADFLTAEI